MDHHRFDNLTKSVARPPSRRQLLRLFGGGGLAVALAASGDTPLAAQGMPCTLTFTGAVRVGPSATQPITTGGQPGVLQGTLTFTADHQGAISQGQIALTGGPTVPVVGQITGRAINLRMSVNDQLVLVAVGTAAQDLTTCQGAVDGLLTGPQTGDLGDWHATASANGGTATPGTGSTTGTTGGGTQSDSAGNSAAPTMTPAATQPTATTGPPTTTTTAPTTTTTTPAPTAPPNCEECSQLSNGTCVPVGDGSPCSAGLCCGGLCWATSSDHLNCGSCYAVCGNSSNGVQLDCVGGHCVCPSGLTTCGSDCSFVSTDPNHCGGCDNVCPSSHPLCINGSCAADHRNGG